MEPEMPGGKIDLFEPILASFVAGSATAIGGLIVFLMRRAPNDRQVSFSLAFSAGVMITVSVLDLWLPSLLARPMTTPLSGLGGYLLCVVLAKLPIPGAEEMLLAARSKMIGMSSTTDGEGRTSGHTDEEEGRGEMSKADPEQGTGSSSSTYPSGSPQRQRGAAAMATSTALSSPDTSKLVVSRGAGASALQAAPQSSSLRRTAALLRLGVLMCVILSLHNLPEGIAVLASTAKSQALGLVVAASIFIHNVAEGLSVAIPIFGATGNRWLALGLTAASGMTEPLGALIAGLLFNRYKSGEDAGLPLGEGHRGESSGGIDTATIVDVVLCVVGGIMVNVSFSELIPSAMAFAKGDKKFVLKGMVCGGVLIALSLLAL
jgi:zinc transporter, ZIP family